MTLLLWMLAFTVALPLLVLAVQCLASLLPSKTAVPAAGGRAFRAAILIPAHDEAAGIGPTLDALLPQMSPQDVVIVIADNCTDLTASRARCYPVTVLERHDIAHRGKGYALAHALDWLQSNPVDVVVVLDADCWMPAPSFQRLVSLTHESGRPVQSAYLMLPPDSPQGPIHLAMMAFTLKNLCRPLGWHRLGFPCSLNGSGMAFPWNTLKSVSLANGRLAEDRWLTVDLALKGHFALFCESARTSSRFPADSEAQVAQRQRWLQGHIEVILFQAPRLLLEAMLGRSLNALALAADLMVPPLVLLTLASVAILLVAGVAFCFGSTSGPMLLVAGALWAAAILSGFALNQQGGFPSGKDLVLSGHSLAKQIPGYLKSLLRRQRQWIRTPRTPGESS